MLFAVWMDLEIIILSEVSQTEKDKCMIDIIYYDVWNLKKMIQINLFAKQTQAHRKQTMITKWNSGAGEGINQDLGINRYILLYIKQINNKNLYPHSTVNQLNFNFFNMVIFLTLKKICCLMQLPLLIILPRSSVSHNTLCY